MSSFNVSADLKVIVFAWIENNSPKTKLVTFSDFCKETGLAENFTFDSTLNMFTDGAKNFSEEDAVKKFCGKIDWSSFVPKFNEMVAFKIGEQNDPNVFRYILTSGEIKNTILSDIPNSSMFLSDAKIVCSKNSPDFSKNFGTASDMQYSIDGKYYNYPSNQKIFNLSDHSIIILYNDKKFEIINFISKSEKLATIIKMQKKNNIVLE